MIELFLNAFFTLFVLADPIGGLPVVMSLTASKRPEEHKRICIKAVIVSFFTLLVFAFLGTTFLQRLGISMSAFHTAGGILLFIVAFQMLFGSVGGSQGSFHESTDEALSHRDIAVFPIAIPLLAGPGSMTAIILLMSRPDSLSSFTEKTTILLAMAAVSISTYLILMTAEPLRKRLGLTGMDVVVRIMGIILAAMSIQYIADGIKGLIQGAGA